MVQRQAITEYKVAYDLSISAIFNDPERPFNTDFKVTPTFDAEYGINGTKLNDRHIFRAKMDN